MFRSLVGTEWRWRFATVAVLGLPSVLNGTESSSPTWVAATNPGPPCRGFPDDRPVEGADLDWSRILAMEDPPGGAAKERHYLSICPLSPPEGAQTLHNG
jgi:hypothetical protein